MQEVLIDDAANFARFRLMMSDRGGNLWIGTTGSGLLKYKQQTARTFAKADGFTYFDTFIVVEDREKISGSATYYGTGTSPEYIDVSDFNGDGNADFAVGNANSANFSVYLGNGAGGFTQAASSPFGMGGSFTRFIVAEDFDRNGKIDIATANEMSHNVSIMTGNGNGGFTLAAQIGTGG